LLAPAARLVVEVDGGRHGRPCRTNARRGRVLERARYRVLRLEVDVLMANWAHAVEVIVKHLG
jgi:very-short-patch-repair endonuclease